MLSYLVTDGRSELIVGSKDMPAAYGAIPALTSAQEACASAEGDCSSRGSRTGYRHRLA